MEPRHWARYQEARWNRFAGPGGLRDRGAPEEDQRIRGFRPEVRVGVNRDASDPGSKAEGGLQLELATRASFRRTCSILAATSVPRAGQLRSWRAIEERAAIPGPR